ncbi:MAG: sugar ABC transporter permease [Chloroflexi bacterium]|nr:MAG: sugar ABC transporter permease [Chloroflexota bacterium]
MYALLLPGVLFVVVFRYVPLLGNVIAFQDYSPYLGFADSAWVGLQNFADLFTTPDVGTALVNTLVISGLQLVLYFPAPIALALLLNSLMSESRLVNQVLRTSGMHTVSVMANPDFFKPLMVLQDVWKEVGWGTIIFLAALTAIDLSLYESAAIDGAGPWRRLRHVSLPGIRGVVVLLLILRLGSILTVGFEQILLQEPNVGAQAGQVLDTFVYFNGVVAGDWGLSAAVGLVKGAVGTLLVVGANWAVKRLGEEGVF